MNLSKFSIKYPYVVFAVLVAVIGFGVISLGRLPVDLFPEFTMPTVMVMIPYPGAGPQEVEKTVIDEAERWLGTISGLDKIESNATDNLAYIQLTFKWGTDMREIMPKIRDNLDIALGEAPAEVHDPLIIETDVSLLPQMMVGVSGGQNPVHTREIAAKISDRLQRVRDVAAADVLGGEKREVLVSMDRRKLTTYNISPLHIEGLLKAHNLNYPLGSITEQGRELDLRLVAEYESLDEIKRTVVGEKGGLPVYLADVASADWSRTESKSAFNINAIPGVSIMIHKSSGANTINLSKALINEIEAIKKELPKEIKVTILYDSAKFVKTSLNSTFWNLITGAILAAFVLFLFLGRMRQTAFVGISIPLSVFIGIIGIDVAGFKIDILSLAGMTVAIGMVVDASIVVFEAIFRHNQSGLSPVDAAETGAKEVGAAIASSTITTIAVFVPLLFLRGFVSVLFKEFSWVMIITLSASLLVALTFIPLATSRFMKKETKENKFQKFSERFYSWLENTYSKMLAWALNHKAYTVFLGLALFVLSIGATFFHQKDFFPNMDRGEITVDITAEAGTSLEQMKSRVGVMEKLVLDSIPELDVMQSTIGSGEGLVSTVRGVAGMKAQIMIHLVEKRKRRRSSEDIEAWLREKARNMPGLEITPAAQTLGSLAFGAEDIALGGTTPIVVEIEGYNLETADSLGVMIADSLRMMPGLVDVRTSAQDRRPGIIFKIRRDLSSRFGMTPYELGAILRAELAGASATSYRVEGDEYDVRIRLSAQDRSILSKIETIEITTPVGQVPLSNMVTIERAPTPSAIHHKGTNRIRTVGANLKGRDLGSASNEVQAFLNRIDPPAGIKLRLSGGFSQMKESFGDLWWVMLLAVVLVYLIMMAQFGSFRFPFIIMFTLPLALVGGIAMLIATGTSLNTFSMLGFIVLVGVVVNNGIVLIDYTNQLRRGKGMALEEAIKEAGRVRMRPVLMTALTTIFGLLPMAIGIGEGTELTTPLARPVLGGLLVATLLTLIFIPVLYYLFEKGREMKKGGKKTRRRIT